MKKLIGKGTGKKDRQAPRWALTKFLILVVKVSGYLATSIVRCRMVDRYKVCVAVSLLSDDFEGCSLKTLSPVIKIFDTDPLTNPVSCEGILEGCKYVLHVTPLFHISVRDRQKEFIEPSLSRSRVCHASGCGSQHHLDRDHIVNCCSWISADTDQHGNEAVHVPKWITSDGYLGHRHEEPSRW